MTTPDAKAPPIQAAKPPKRTPLGADVDVNGPTCGSPWYRTVLVSSGTSDGTGSAAVPFGTVKPKEQGPKTPFGERLHRAAEIEGTSVTKLSRDHFDGPLLHRYVYGDRGEQVLEAVAKLYAVARTLHVNFEWLVLGEGPMRRDGRDDTPAEKAIAFARKNGAREDALKAAWEENSAHEKDWTVWQWVEAIDAKVRHLEREGVPRPEKVREHQKEIAKVSAAKRKRVATAKLDAASTPPSAPPHPRVAGVRG